MLPDHYPLFSLFSGKRVHLGLTGSIAAYKALELLRLLDKSSIGFGATLTRAGSEFIKPLSLSALGADPVHSGQDLDHYDPFSHLAPMMSAHCFVIAPATANILAKASCGLADDLLSTQILAFDKPVLFCPAMNPAMWSNQATVDNITRLISRGHVIIQPHQGVVACKSTGQGKLAPVPVLYYQILKSLAAQDLAGHKVLVTAGPTCEYFDRVRFFSNPSTGRMGLAVALACWIRGAEVDFIHGPMQQVFELPGFRVHQVTTARQMLDTCTPVWKDSSIGIFTAAVSDFAPRPSKEPKFKKQGRKTLTMEMEATPDVLASLSVQKTGRQILVGFAAEAEELLANARQKLGAKNLDIIVANQVGAFSTPFGSSTNQVTVLDCHGRNETWPDMPKADVAWRLVDWIVMI
ncbi:bifunctional phosphopantothenoylcysteine decarboxylase/phosphopantothenate--cysteine ligase CoaBC [Desulfonatronovibrio hydrogenovorans]|uniref:bifunctional phosphopantothenoylcysteine decarboxylase/phosphopantothenate--cysteine ligase CoaBC n=1 Tax=Desulfonatronovibrio hydrogenovorans TaxID=53245 RepID=UPI00048DF6C4|nr:bifunctional phosphopantothenoylcysteine decarboxylase/phosphopantothenate--cysteine ligase CoaBC [Desulfonatronovibrio hydrogenovorans]